MSEVDIREALKELAGKRIASASWDWADADPRAFGVLTLKFDDGSDIKLASYDYEGYSSGIELWDSLEEKERQAWLSALEEDDS